MEHESRALNSFIHFTRKKSGALLKVNQLNLLHDIAGK